MTDLPGGLGRDFLEGGSGADRFLFLSVGEGIDKISDFSRKERDKIDLSELMDKAEFDFVGRAGNVSNGELAFFNRKGDTFVIANAPDGGDDFKIRFDGIIDFREGDFIL